MVENKIEMYKMGSFLTRNTKASNLGNFFGTVGRTKESLTKTIAQRDKMNDNCALLTRSDDPDGPSLQLIHSLFVGRDTSSDSPKLIGFLGYSNFENPVEVPPKLASSVMTGLRALEGVSEGGELPSGADLLQSDTSNLAEEFLDVFDPENLSTKALVEAKRIPRSLLLDSSVLGLLRMEKHQTASELLCSICLNAETGDVDSINELVRFLWATAKGLNLVTMAFGKENWDTSTQIKISNLKEQFHAAERKFLLDLLSGELSDAGDENPADGKEEINRETAEDPPVETVGTSSSDESDTGLKTNRASKSVQRAKTTGKTAQTAGGTAKSSRFNTSTFGSTAKRLVSSTPSSKTVRQVQASDSDEDSEDSDLSERGKSAARKRNRKRRKKGGSPASRRTALQMEQLIAAASMMASATETQSQDNRARLESDLMKKSLVKNLTDEQQLMTRVVTGGLFDASPPQDVATIQLPIKASELLKHSNLKLFENKLRQVTEDYPCQPDPGLFGNFISIDGFRKGTNSQTGGLTVFMMHPFSHQESEPERRRRISILIEDATDKDYAEKILDSDYFFPTSVEQALIMLESLLKLIAHISVPGGTIASEGYALGLKLIDANRRKIAIRQRDDKLFITKLLHQLDHNDQNFYDDLLGLIRDPLTKQYPLAHAGLCRRDRIDGISRVFNSLRDDLESRFRLPEQLQAAFRKSETPKKTPLAPACGSPAPKNSPKPPKPEQDWWRVKPVDDSNAWLLPTGKSFYDYFEDNDRTLLAPHIFNHHKLRKKRPICLKWLTVGKCTVDCFCAHTRVKQMNKTEIAALDEKILGLYGTL
jgi:hypothetical protein